MVLTKFLLLHLLSVSIVNNNKYFFPEDSFQISFRLVKSLSQNVVLFVACLFICLFIGRITKPIHDWLLLVLMQKLSFDDLFMTKCCFKRHSCRIKYLSTLTDQQLSNMNLHLKE